MLLYIAFSTKNYYKTKAVEENKLLTFTINNLPINYSNIPTPPTKNENVKNPTIAILVSNIGVNNKITEQALSLPKEIAFGIPPFLEDTLNVKNKIKASGREMLLYLPLEISHQTKDMEGSIVLFSNSPTKENITKISHILKNSEIYAGFYTPPEETFTKNSKNVEIFRYLEEKGIPILNTKKPKSFKSKNLTVDVIIDQIPEEQEVMRNLNTLIHKAKNNGYAIGYSNGYRISIQSLLAWLPALARNNVKLVNISEVIGNYDQ